MPDEPSGGAPDAASVMQATISEFQSQGGGDPSPAPAPAPSPAPPSPEPQPPAPVNPLATDPNQPPADQQDADWYKAMLADFDQQPADELTTLLDETAFNGLRENPQGLSDWSQKAFGRLREFNANAERERALAERAERIGGWDKAPQALDLYGDMFRGDLALEEADAAYPEARTYAERALMRMLQSDKVTGIALGRAVLNHMPDLIKYNRDYLLHSLGFDPKYAEDYKRVAEAGGFQITEDQAGIQQWFKENEIPLEQLNTLRRLPIKVQQDLLAGDAEAGKFHLQEYHDRFQSKDREAKAGEERQAQEAARVEYESLKTLGSEQRKVFDEYVAKGKAYGLNDLEAAGLAAMAYAEIEGQYWEDGSESRRLVDQWHEYVKSGNKLQSESGRSTYRKAFESAYRKAAGQYQPKRPGVPPKDSTKQPSQNGANNGNNDQQFNPAPSPDDKFKNLTGEELMKEMLRERYGATV